MRFPLAILIILFTLVNMDAATNTWKCPKCDTTLHSSLRQRKIHFEVEHPGLYYCRTCGATSCNRDEMKSHCSVREEKQPEFEFTNSTEEPVGESVRHHAYTIRTIRWMLKHEGKNHLSAPALDLVVEVELSIQICNTYLNK